MFSETMTVARVWTLLVSASVLGLAAGSRGWDDQGPRRYSPYAEVMRVRRQQQGPQRAQGVRIKPFGGNAPLGPQRVQPQRPVNRRQGAFPQNRRLVPLAPVEAPRQQARPVQAASNTAEKRVLKTYQPEYNDYEYEPEPVQYKRQPEPVQFKRQPEPERPQRVYEPKPVYERSPVRADKRQDSAISESIAVPREQHDLEASVHAAANGYRGVSGVLIISLSLLPIVPIFSGELC